jgi:hypothetical protein
MKSDADVVKDRDDLEMLKRPHLWTGGRLCVKRRAKKKGRHVGGAVYDAYAVINSGELPLVLRSHGDNKTWMYASAEAAIAAGWLVD